MNTSGVERGIITKIYAQNFVTYDDVVIKPGRNLNVIIGPNGSGKSTIVCAIVIGLNGNIRIIGRATRLADYVKEGKEVAKIEITLKEDGHRETVITRMFDTHGKNTWMLDGKVENHKVVAAKIASFNIQMDNLCQFLPQDKVQDFSKMDPKQLLESTERSIGDGRLYEYHEKLKNYRVMHKDTENVIVNKTRYVNSKTEKYDSLKEVVSGIKERKVIKNKIIALKQKKAWLMYDEKRTSLLELKKLKDRIEGERKSIQTKLQPIQNEINKMKSEITMLQHSVNDHNNKVLTKNTKIKKLLQKINECDENVKANEETCKAKIQAEQTRDNDILTIEQQKNKLENDLGTVIKEIGSENSLKDKQREVAFEMDKRRNEINKLTQAIDTYKQQEISFSREIAAQQQDLESVDISAKRLELLKQRSVDAYRGVLWLRENRNKFAGTIYEPMLLHINVKDARKATFLESVLSYRDLIAFVCEDKQDMNLLLKCLREEQNLQVNVLHSDPNKHVNMQPHIPISSIEKYGFQDYLVSLIDAPPTIMKYLVLNYHLHNIPVGTNSIEDHVDSIPQSLRLYMSESTIYQVRVSKYSGEKSTSYSGLSRSGLLSVTMDESKIRNIQKNIEHSKEKRIQVQKMAADLKERLHKEDKELERVREERNKCQHSLQQVQVLKSRISMAEEKIQKLKGERSSVEEIKARTKKAIQTMIQKQMETYKEYNSVLEDYFKCITTNEEICLALQLRQRSLVAKENETQELRQQYSRAEQQVEEMRIDLNNTKKDTETLYDEAKKTTNGLTPQDAAFKKINKTFAKLPSTIGEINDELNTAQAKVYCMGSNVDGEKVLQEFEALEAEIADTNEVIKEKVMHLQKIEDKIKITKEKWLPPLQKLVDKINDSFSSHFSTMKCVGEVNLTHGSNPLNFDQYGLQIKVKFRDADELQELTRHFQSGGERAVTTAVYMIALQELTRVPFRCVDEINQGMDAMNERRIFELLVEITGKPGSSQYFLLTPKLVPDLQYDETVTIICIFNGPFMISHTEFNIEDYCKDIKRLHKQKKKT